MRKRGIRTFFSVCLCASVGEKHLFFFFCLLYTISIFAFSLNCLAKVERRFSYLLFCKSVRRSAFTWAKGCLAAGLCAFNRKMVKALSIWIRPLTCPACMASAA